MPLRSGLSPFDEGQQVGVHDLSVHRAHRVRVAERTLESAHATQLRSDRIGSKRRDDSPKTLRKEMWLVSRRRPARMIARVIHSEIARLS
jgi:hypothetical protein